MADERVMIRCVGGGMLHESPISSGCVGLAACNVVSG